MNKKIVKIFYDWQEYQKDIKSLYKYLIKLNGLFTTIYGIPKGGLVPAVHLAYLLDKKLILDPDKISKKTLVIGDISDTGKTLKKLLENKKYFSVITLWTSTDTHFIPHAYGRKIKLHEWVIFPWSNK